MDSDQYILERVDNQISFYDSKSQSSQKSYKRLSAIQIVCGALIPLISGFSKEISYSEWIIAFLGVAVSCSTAFLSLNKYQEQWMNYRTTCESLKHLKHLFLTGSVPYKSKDSFGKFVNDIESLISKENSDWGQYIGKEADEKE